MCSIADLNIEKLKLQNNQLLQLHPHHDLCLFNYLKLY